MKQVGKIAGKTVGGILDKALPISIIIQMLKDVGVSSFNEQKRKATLEVVKQYAEGRLSTGQASKDLADIYDLQLDQINKLNSHLSGNLKSSDRQKLLDELENENSAKNETEKKIRKVNKQAEDNETAYVVETTNVNQARDDRTFGQKLLGDLSS